ncbi:MAG TPA: ATP-binding protein [Candidatus Saccharimonadales bacterium]|nr:ATP-binding protein [Candidatus Saccharimonadales bacterium]
MPEEAVATDLDQRIEDVVDADADLRPIAEALAARRDSILEAWLRIAREQPFHQDKPDAAVADHIPTVLDSIIAILWASERASAVVAPMDDPTVAAAAADHARVRFEQGLGPVAVVTEFRLLRHEISRALIDSVADAPAADILAGQAVIDDALDGAAAIGLSALSQRIETLREEFLATTLHDVRQPITLVTGSLDLAARWLAEPEPDHARLADVIDSAVLAVGEINTMLDTLGDATRVAMGAIDLQTEPTTFESIIEEALALLDPESRRRVTFAPPAGPRLVGVWDPNLLRRVVINLVSNALKYSPEDGPVRIELARDGGMARLQVRDHGMGLESSELRMVFERFVRADRARAQGIPGLGLGLYACRGIVSAHEGTIELTSDGPSLGTIAEVCLPLVDDDGEG